MRPGPRYWLLLLTGLLAACATSSPVGPDALEAPPEVVDSWQEGCEDPRTLVLLCQEETDECGLFLCREVVPGRLCSPLAGEEASPGRVLRALFAAGGGEPGGLERPGRSSPSGSTGTLSPNL